MDTSLEGELHHGGLLKTRGVGLCFCQRQRYKGTSHPPPVDSFLVSQPLVGTNTRFSTDYSLSLSLPIMHPTLIQLVSTLLCLANLIWSLPTPAPSDLEERQSLNPTRNDLSGPCKPITVLFARGTVELGNVGLLAGVPFVNMLGSMIGFNNIAVQGVNYPADIPGYLLGGSSSGTKTLAGLLKTAASKCPDTQIVLGGYR